MKATDSASATSPFNGYGSGICDSFGAGGTADQFLFSGLFYGDLTTGTSLGTSLYLGTNLTQLYPLPNASPTAGMCRTPVGGNVYCYGEFPWMFHDGTKMLFLGNTVTQAAIVDLCTAASGCQANFTAEIVQAQVSADYTQSALPMQIAAFGSFSTMMDQGTPNRGQTLSPTNMSSACGLQHSGSDYGNCGHLDIDGGERLPDLRQPDELQLPRLANARAPDHGRAACAGVFQRADSYSGPISDFGRSGASVAVADAPARRGY